MSSSLEEIQLSDVSSREELLRVNFNSDNSAGIESSSEGGAQINEGALISFDVSLSVQNKNDISNSFLFAQLAADKKFNRHSATLDWLKTFSATLGVVGWTINASKNSTTIAPSPADWTEIVSHLVPENVQMITGSSIKASQELPVNGKAMTVWKGAALDKNDGILIVATGWVVKGTLSLSVVGIDFAFQHEFSGFMRWAESFSLSIQSVTLTLNEDIYAQVRQAIIAKLGDRPDYLVVNVPLK